MKVKVCGMADVNIMHQLAKLNISMLGFIFYPKSPRYMVEKIPAEEISKLPENIQKVGVFVNASEEEILSMATKFHLTTIQLHGSETPEFCKKIKEHGLKVWKAFNLTKNNNFQSYSPFCEYFLFDTPSEKHGGTGEKFDWSLLNTYKGNIPFLLSGGISANDAEEVKQIQHPQMAGIDINSKFEITPGIKNVELIKKFIAKILPPVPLKGKQLASTKDMHWGANPILFDFAKSMRANPTEAESFLWKQLSDTNYKSWHFRRQHPILYFIADFYSHKAELVIEVDGGYHQIPQQYKYDQSRDNELNELGIQVLRFSNEDILFNIEHTLKQIDEILNQNNNE